MDLTITTPEKSAETQEIADEVTESRERIRKVDSEAYGGFVTDEACRAVGRRRDMRAVDVLRAWRAHHPLRDPSALKRQIPPGAKQPSDEAKAVA
jgi:hypothetical protein